ncbi:MAG: HRDC domain-containing protein, partial [Magnetospirillum sp. WYHS-4]
RRAAGQPDRPEDRGLFEALRAKRLALAREQGVPPYVIFHDSTLLEMAAARPRSLDDLGRLNGVGSAKLQRYGKAFLDVVGGHQESYPA